MKTAAAPRRLPARTLLLFAFTATLLFAVLAPPVFAQSPSPSESPLTDNRPVLGILGLSAPDGRGVTVARVVPDSGADDAGLEAGDLITDFEGTRVTSMEDLTTAMDRFEIDDTVTVTYERDGESRTAEVELGSSSSSRNANPFRIPNFEPRFPEEIPNAPRQPDAPNFRANRADGTDYRPVLWLFGTLITAALVTLIVLQVRKNRSATKPAVETSAYVPPAAATAGNPLEVLKMRYAKGEITRDEYLTMSSDLNGSGGPASEQPTQQL